MRRLALTVALLAVGARAADWPEWRGDGRRGVWEETGIVERFPAGGPLAVWRTPIGAGYAGPSVAAGRVFVTDFEPGPGGARGTERLLALDSASGAVLWTIQWPADYTGLDYASGPRATPTVDGERVYALGAAGELVCARTATGEVVWRTNYVRDFGTQLPPWGMSSAPLVVDDLLLAVVHGRPDAKVVAFDKGSGRERWRALSPDAGGPGYSQPILIEADGRRQAIVWHAGAVSALDPATGAVLWEHDFPIRMETPIATPVWSPPHLLVSAFFDGARLLRLAGGAAELVWRTAEPASVASGSLRALMAAPIVEGGHVYGVSSYGELRCLRLADGEVVWETQALTVERARNASAFLVRQGDRIFANNDRGELVIARLSPEGYREIDRAKLIRPTSKPGARRELGAVNWSHPAYAERSVFARNDEEIVRVSLAAELGKFPDQRLRKGYSDRYRRSLPRLRAAW